MTPARLLAFAAVAACSAPHSKQERTAREAIVVKPRSLITMTAEPTAGLVAADAAARLAVRIRIHAPPLADADRPPLNLALVLDTSASMKGESIANLKLAARSIVEHMAAHDRLSLITFSSRAAIGLESTAMTAAGRATAVAAIDEIVADGTTDLAEGIDVGLQQVLAHRTAGGIDRMVLLADGFPNDPSPIPGLIQRAASNRIAITTLGIGIEHSQEMLAAIARDTGGIYRYAPDGKEIAAVFEKELLRMQTLVAHDLALRIDFGPGVTLASAPWLTAMPGGRAAHVALGDLAAGETRDVIVPVDVPGHRAGLTVELLDAELGFRDAMSGAAETRSAFVGVEASDDAAAIAASTKADLAIGQARAEAAGAIIQAINIARGGGPNTRSTFERGALDRAKQLLAEAEKVARARADELGDDELAELAERMTELGRNLVQIRPVHVVGDVPSSDGDLTAVPASAPAAIEPAIRETYQKAKATIDPR